MFYDIPRSNGNTFIIFSAIPVGSSTGPGVVKLTVTLSSLTGISSLTGGLNNDVLEITPNTAHTGFDILCKARDTAGVYQFDCSATSVGDAESNIGSATSNFTFHVVLCGADAVFDVIIRTYRVGQVVNDTLGLSPVCPIHDYRVQGALRTADDNAYVSGLTLWVQTIDDTDIPRLTGTAERPGIYVASLDVTTLNDNAASGGSGTNFRSGQNMAVPVIVCIYEHPYQPGQLVQLFRREIAINTDLIRVVRVSDSVLSTYPNITGSFNRSEDMWSRNYTTTHYGSSDTWYTYENYQMTVYSGVWTLKGRIYNSGDAVPDWTELSTADAVPECAVPPSSGWSNGVVVSGFPAGCVEEEGTDYGMFDWKGEDSEGHIIAQQAVNYTKQYDGWNRPAEFRYTDGFIYKWNSETGEFGMFTKSGAFLAAVALTAVVGVAVPIDPPVVEKYGDTQVRDAAVTVAATSGDSTSGSSGGNTTKVAISVSGAPAAGALARKAGGVTGEIVPFYQAQRQWVPYNGTSGDVIKTGGLTVKVETGTRVFRDYDKIWEIDYGTIAEHNAETVDEAQDTKKGIEITLSGNLLCGKRDKDIPEWFGIFGTPAVSGVYEKSRTYHQYQTTYFIGYEEYATGIDQTISITSTDPEANTDARIQSILFCTACAPDYETNKEHQPWSIAVADIGGSWTAQYTTVTTTAHTPAQGGDGTSTVTSDDSHSGTLRRVMMKPSRELGIIESSEDNYESRNFTLTISTYKNYSLNGSNYFPTMYQCQESISLALDGENATVTHVFGDRTDDGYVGSNTLDDFPVTTTTTTYTGTKSAMYTKYDELRAVAIARSMPSLPDRSYPDGAGGCWVETSRDANETVTYNNYTWSAAE